MARGARGGELPPTPIRGRRRPSNAGARARGQALCCVASAVARLHPVRGGGLLLCPVFSFSLCCSNSQKTTKQTKNKARSLGRAARRWPPRRLDDQRRRLVHAADGCLPADHAQLVDPKGVRLGHRARVPGRQKESRRGGGGRGTGTQNRPRTMTKQGTHATPSVTDRVVPAATSRTRRYSRGQLEPTGWPLCPQPETATPPLRSQHRSGETHTRATASTQEIVRLPLFPVCPPGQPKTYRSSRKVSTTRRRACARKL